jgi:hypothetical protein
MQLELMRVQQLSVISKIVDYGDDVSDEDRSSHQHSFTFSRGAHPFRQPPAVLASNEFSILCIPFPPPLVQSNASCSLNV